VRRRAKGSKKLFISWKAEVRTLALIIAAAVIPVLGTVLVISATSRPGLSDLVPIQNSAGNYFVLNWSTLLRDHPHSLNAGSPVFSGAPVQALGYMVESDRAIGEGEWIQDFVLLPEAGNLMHPAHRFGDQMIAVHLQENARVQFSARALVWVWGAFGASPGDPAGSKPLYSLERALAQSADREEIAKYFK
jgi:hypothetical protein